MSHYGCKKYSNLQRSTTIQRQITHSLELRGRTMKTYFEICYFKPTFLEPVQKNALFVDMSFW